MSNVIYLPENVRAANGMRRAINERASRIHAREPSRLHAVCEGVRQMRGGRSSSAAVQLGWQELKAPPQIQGFGGFRA